MQISAVEVMVFFSKKANSCPLCAVKLSNKFIAILFSNRKRLDEGIPLNNLTFPPQVEINLDSLSDSSEESDVSFSDLSGNDESSFSSSNYNYDSAD